MKVCKVCERVIILREHPDEPIVTAICEYCQRGLKAWHEYCQTHKLEPKPVQERDIDEMLRDTVYRAHRTPVIPKRQLRRERWNRKGRKYG